MVWLGISVCVLVGTTVGATAVCRALGWSGPRPGAVIAAQDLAVWWAPVAAGAGALGGVVLMAATATGTRAGALGLATACAVGAVTGVGVGGCVVTRGIHRGKRRGKRSAARWGVEAVGDGVVTVCAANVLNVNADPQGCAEDLAGLDCDVYALAEMTGLHAGAVAARLGAPVAVDHSGVMATHIYTRLACAPVEAIVAGDRTFPCVRLAEGTLAGTYVVAVHTLSPTRKSRSVVWSAQLDALARLVDGSLDHPAAGGPVILAGDFNASLLHGDLVRVLEAGAQDASQECGRGLVRTWRRLRGRWRLLGLDHVVVHDVSVVAARRVELRGSDHDAIVAALSAPGAQYAGGRHDS